MTDRRRPHQQRAPAGRSLAAAFPTAVRWWDRTHATRLARWRWLVVRRLVAASVAALGLVAAIGALQPGPAPREDRVVVVAAREIPMGAVVTAEDVTTAPRPVDALVDGTRERLADVVGRRVLGPVVRGEVLVSARLAGSGVLSGLPPDRRAVSVAVANPGILGVLQPGDRVDVLGGQGVGVVARRAIVVSGGSSTRARVAGDANGLLTDTTGGGSDGTTTQLLLAVTTDEITSIAAAANPAAGPSGFTIAVWGP